MSDEKKEAPKYNIGTAIQSAVGDYAQVNNYFSMAAVQQNEGTAALRELFTEVNRRLANLPPADREMLAPAVKQTAEATAAIQQGDESEEKQGFLATRLRNLYNMAPDIGAVIIATLASPAAGIALTIQKIAAKAKQEFNIKDAPAAA